MSPIWSCNSTDIFSNFVKLYYRLYARLWEEQLFTKITNFLEEKIYWEKTGISRKTNLQIISKVYLPLLKDLNKMYKHVALTMVR